MIANFVAVPERTSPIYPSFGVDFRLDAKGEGEGIWVEAENPTMIDFEWDITEADEIIAAHGYKRVTGWAEIDKGGARYLTAEIVPAVEGG